MIDKERTVMNAFLFSHKRGCRFCIYLEYRKNKGNVLYRFKCLHCLNHSHDIPASIIPLAEAEELLDYNLGIPEDEFVRQMNYD